MGLWEKFAHNISTIFARAKVRMVTWEWGLKFDCDMFSFLAGAKVKMRTVGVWREVCPQYVLHSR